MQRHTEARIANPVAPPVGRETEETVKVPSQGRSWLDLSVRAWLPLNREVGVYLLLMLVAGVLRFWDLGARAMHHDESLHALYSYYLYAGRGYIHDPMMHGPVQFHVNALFYFLFGVSDYTARIQYALLGTLLVGMPYFLRERLGRTGALVVALMFVFSPSLLYYSRFARNDILIAVWNLGLVICLWRYLSERRSLYLYLGAAFLSLGFATKEVSWIHAVLFCFFLLGATWQEWLGLLGRGLFPGRAQLTLSPAAGFLMLLGTLSLPQFAAAFSLVSQALRLNLGAPVFSLGGPFQITTGHLLGALVVVLLVGVTTVLGIWWNRRDWLRAALIFYAIYLVLYTTFFTNPPGLATGIWGSLGYWLAQHDVQRGGQPWHYYLAITPIYEFLPLLFSVVAAVYYAWRRSLFTTFLIYWVGSAFLSYSSAGEKMPWLLVHLALPLILLSGKFIGEWLDGINWPEVRARGAFWLVPLLPLAVWALVAVLREVRVPREQSVNPVELLALLLALGVIVGLAAQLGWRIGRARTLQMGTLALILVLAAFTIRASWIATYQNGDTPVEMLVYTQTSPDIPKIKADIDEIARRTGEGANLKITVDATESFTWPWAWYLRDYKNVDYPTLGSISSPPLGSVLFLHSSNVERARPFLNKYGQGQKARLRWWFPEDYKSGPEWVRSLWPEEKKKNQMPTRVGLGDIIGASLSPTGLEKLWNYWMYRQTLNPLGSSDGVVYYPREATQMAVAPPKPPPPDELTTKQINVPSVLAFGSRGPGEGQLNEPKSVAVDQQGNIYVLDSLNFRVQKFDRSGKFLQQWGSQGTGEGQFAGNFGGAWGIAVDPAGNVFVVDTWNHRVQKFDAEGKFLQQWGGGLTDNRGQIQGNESKFYGPRGIAIDAQGNVYVTDTGNHRVQKFDGNGRFQGAFGGRGAGDGQLNEPVGVAVDGAGNVYVADTWNRRIQKFDRSFRFLAQFPVYGWESDSLVNKPGIAIEPNGNVVVTDPEGSRLFRYTPAGALLAVVGRPGVDNASFNLPMGIATDATGSIYVVESANHRVQKFDLPK